MSKFLRPIENLMGELIALSIGWLVCVFALGGAYTLGEWAAPYLGWHGNPDMFGLLSALTFFWIYEHRNLEGKYDRLRELISGQ